MHVLAFSTPCTIPSFGPVQAVLVFEWSRTLFGVMGCPFLEFTEGKPKSESFCLHGFEFFSMVCSNICHHALAQGGLFLNWNATGGTPMHSEVLSMVIFLCGEFGGVAFWVAELCISGIIRNSDEMLGKFLEIHSKKL